MKPSLQQQTHSLLSPRPPTSPTALPLPPPPPRQSDPPSTLVRRLRASPEGVTLAMWPPADSSMLYGKPALSSRPWKFTLGYSTYFNADACNLKLILSNFLNMQHFISQSRIMLLLLPWRIHLLAILLPFIWRSMFRIQIQAYKQTLLLLWIKERRMCPQNKARNCKLNYHCQPLGLWKTC